MFPKFCIFLIRHSPLNIVGTIERFKAEKLIFFSNFLGSKILLTGPLLFVFLNYEFPLVFFPSFPLFQKLATEPLFYFNWRIYFNCTVGLSSLCPFCKSSFAIWFMKSLIHICTIGVCSYISFGYTKKDVSSNEATMK